MDYIEADRIRKKTLSDRIAEKMVKGESFGKSVSKSISEGSKARVTNIKRKFDPMNIAKFMTGGSDLAPAIVGRLMGRSKKDMQYFTGRTGKIDTASKIKPLQQGEGVLGMLQQIYGLLIDIREKRESEKPTEEDIFEKNRAAANRHNELMNALKALNVQKKETATKVDETGTESGGSLFDDILAAFGMKEIAKSAIGGLGRLAAWAVGPVGGVILGAGSVAALTYIMFKMLTDKSGYEDKDSELSKGLKQAQEVGGLAGVLDTMEKRKGLPEYTRTLLELQDAENTFWKDADGNPQFGTDVQLEGYAKRSPEAASAVEAYKKKRDIIKGVSTKETTTSVKPTEQALPGKETPAESPVTPSAAPSATGTATQISSEQTAPAAGTETTPTTMGSVPTAASAAPAKETLSLTSEGASATPESLSPTAVPTIQQKSITSPTSAAPASTGSAAMPAPAAAPTSAATQVMSVPKSEMSKALAAPSITNTAIPMESTPSSAAVNSVISENLDMNLPTVQSSALSDVINNTTVSSQSDSPTISNEIPSVRNMEETFRRMIVYSTRVV